MRPLHQRYNLYLSRRFNSAAVAWHSHSLSKWKFREIPVEVASQKPERASMSVVMWCSSVLKAKSFALDLIISWLAFLGIIVRSIKLLRISYDQNWCLHRTVMWLLRVVRWVPPLTRTLTTMITITYPVSPPRPCRGDLQYEPVWDFDLLARFYVRRDSNDSEPLHTVSRRFGRRPCVRGPCDPRLLRRPFRSRKRPWYLTLVPMNVEFIVYPRVSSHDSDFDPFTAVYMRFRSVRQLIYNKSHHVLNQ